MSACHILFEHAGAHAGLRMGLAGLQQRCGQACADDHCQSGSCCHTGSRAPHLIESCMALQERLADCMRGRLAVWACQTSAHALPIPRPLPRPVPGPACSASKSRYNRMHRGCAVGCQLPIPWLLSADGRAACFLQHLQHTAVMVHCSCCLKRSDAFVCAGPRAIAGH